jgi:hypothetical protein
VVVSVVCNLCGKKIVLVPSAAERAAKDVTGKTAADYQALFIQHPECYLAKKREEHTALMRRLKAH